MNSLSYLHQCFNGQLWHAHTSCCYCIACLPKSTFRDMLTFDKCKNQRLPPEGDDTILTVLTGSGGS
jgi:hypothetical protein